MARVSIQDGQLFVELQGLHQLWAFKRGIRVPLAHVRGATVDPGVVRGPKGVRAPGLHLPGSAVIGTFNCDGEKHFWDVRTGRNAIVIELLHERYTRLIVDVEQPRAIVDLINQAMSRPAR